MLPYMENTLKLSKYRDLACFPAGTSGFIDTNQEELGYRMEFPLFIMIVNCMPSLF